MSLYIRFPKATKTDIICNYLDSRDPLQMREQATDAEVDFLGVLGSVKPETPSVDVLSVFARRDLYVTEADREERTEEFIGLARSGLDNDWLFHFCRSESLFQTGSISISKRFVAIDQKQ